MPAIVAPRPRASTVPALAMPHELSYSKVHPRVSLSLNTTPRLLSPIQLAPSSMSPITPLLAPSALSHSQIPRSSCPPAPRRRQKPYTTAHHRRRLPVSPPIRLVDPQSTHTFDQLPWIAELNAPQDPFDLWDIADLSQIRDHSPSPSCSAIPISGPGPVRHRRTSLRTFALAPDLIQSPPSYSHADSRPSTPLRDTQLPVRTHTPRSITPRPRFNPSRVLFHHLMPVLCESDSDRCTFTPSLHLR